MFLGHAFPGSLLLFATLSLLVGILWISRLSRLWLALTLAGSGAALAAALRVLTGADWEWRSRFALCGEPLHLRLDGLSAFFLALLAVVSAAGAAYGWGYWTEASHPASARRGRAWWNVMVLSMGALLLSSNGLHFLIAWELFSVSGYFLIALDRGRREARAAGWQYLAASHAGTLCLCAFFALLAARTGSWELGPMRDQAGLAPLFWLALIGFGTKAGLFPFHLWLPAAHANAPSHVSALMSGIAIKMGVYGLFRFSGWLPVPAAAVWALIGLGMAGAVLGIAFALAQIDLKRLLAYSSVENIGIIALALGGALLATGMGEAPWGRLILAGALLHVWSHGLFKALLFFGAGSVLHATGTREMSLLGGLWRAMPWTAGLFAIGAAAVSALPPLNGFVGEWLVYVGWLDAAAHPGLARWAAAPATLALAVAGALALASFVKAGAIVFLGAPRTPAAAAAHESGPWLLGPMLVLAGACVTIGLAPLIFWPAVARALGAWQPHWMMMPAPAPLAILGRTHLALALWFVLAAAALWRKARANGLRRAPTWDCGYAAPTPRMQYTAGSFAGIATGWFGWILQPRRHLRRPIGPFPTQAVRIERFPETVLERVVRPAALAIMRAAHEARRLQHGRVQFYVMYVVGGLALLAALIFLMRNP